MSESDESAGGPDNYDLAFRVLHDSPLVRALWAEALGDQYPAEVDPFSSCCWWLLGQVVAGLRLQPDDTLLDLGCGRGGPGLWLARALSAHLVGVDCSPVAIELARSRSPLFVTEGRATFRVAEFGSTGLAAGSAQGAVSIDALPFARDRADALREVHRLLTSGGRLVFSAAQDRAPVPGSPGAWDHLLDEAGFDLEERVTHAFHHEHWRRLYGLWREHADDLRTELGEVVANALLTEAAGADQFDGQDALLFVARRRDD